MHQIALQRLYNQRLVGTPFDKPEAVVAWMGAVQSQEYALAKWALGQRTAAMSDDLVDQAFAAGKILRTHVMRPTWHFVTPFDIRWMLQLTAPRVHALNAYMYRKLELDEALLQRANGVLAEALEGGQQLTREELATALEAANIAAKGMRLGYIMHYAELEAVVCSGPRRGKQFTYMLLDERAPHARTLAPDEALAELVTRFFHRAWTRHDP
ncbi:MAG: winged helix DNA-binding domain-containing protein [Chloroflexi bacterium]|uniref:DNA glycosylase AlkZ-like family protein n=1 Tax=Candidatus Flexifilum breve TaxID=3140694 RepID=UPI0031360839|nr:winged helix DNA-binding domain-containing protein [Chloroflexota bacterium]